MKKLLVIGYGNPLRSDDSVGLKAVRLLNTLISDARVEFIERQQLSVELAAPIAEASYVVFIDASTDGIAGEVRYEMVSTVSHSPAALSHQADPAMLLEAAQQLYGNAPEALLATVAGECFGFGTQLSPVVEQSMHGVVQNIARTLKGRLTTATAATA